MFTKYMEHDSYNYYNGSIENDGYIYYLIWTVTPTSCEFHELVRKEIKWYWIKTHKCIPSTTKLRIYFQKQMLSFVL